jgi:hypothetical protein
VTPARICFTPVVLARDIQDRHARLVHVDGALAAVLVRLDHEAHDDLQGAWVVEVGFGPFDSRSGPVFDNLEEAECWFLRLAPPARSQNLSPA